MNWKAKAFGFICIFVAGVVLSACTSEGADTDTTVTINALPDFSAYSDVKEKKKAFFDFLRPIVEQENSKVARERDRMLALYARIGKGEAISASEIEWLNQLAEKYRVEMTGPDDNQAQTLLKRRVDTVPFRLALAQAANESSWGTSRFARQGLNFFGQWCFTQGCGMVPVQRSKGMTHEVATYASVNDSVAAYIRSINRVHMYTPLRTLRRSIKKRGDRPTAVELAQELTGYSERGEAYVSEIQSMIRVNYDLMAPTEKSQQAAMKATNSI